LDNLIEYFDGKFWNEVRICHPTSNEHFEVIIILNLNISHFDKILKPPFEDILLKNGIQNRIEPLLHILNKERISLPDAILQLIHESRVVQFCDKQIVAFLPLLDPDVSLGLGVDYQRPADAVVDDHAVLLGEVVGGQVGFLPLAHLVVVRKNSEGEGMGGKRLGMGK
jgi:hypothetical protein